MSNGNKETQKPYRLLGDKLRRIRENRSESPEEVCGAVEIDIEELRCYEAGKKRPDEELLLMMISHFSSKDEEAETLWKLAGYDNDELKPDNNASDPASGQPLVVMMPADMRINFTDQVHVSANKHGVVLNFMQPGANNKAQVVARVGMSREHAKSMIDILQKTMFHSEQKKLPPAASSN